MVRSGLIVGIIALFVAAGATLISPLCAPCAVIFLGIGAGYLTGVFDKPSTRNGVGRVGAIGGAVGGVGAIIGQIIGAIINSIIVGPEQIQQIYQNFGLPSGSPTFTQLSWLRTGSTVCFSLLDVLLMAGFGALGGLFWWQTTGKNATPQAPTVIS
jgi:hypothetical protein